MDILDQKVIEISKTKILLLILISSILLGISLWLTFLDVLDIGSRFKFKNPSVIHGIGWTGISIFGLFGVLWIKKIFDNKPGLTLSNLGVTDNSSGASFGFISWDDIDSFNVYQVQQQKLLIVVLKEPGKYIETGNSIKRSINRANHKLCGSPVAITSNSLKIGFDELLNSCNQYLKKYGTAY